MGQLDGPTATLTITRKDGGKPIVQECDPALADTLLSIALKASPDWMASATVTRAKKGKPK